MIKFKRTKNTILSLCLALVLLVGMVPLSSVSALTDDFILFDFTEEDIMKTSADSKDGIFWTAPTASEGHQTFEFVEENGESFYRFTNADDRDDPFFYGSLGDHSFSSDYKYVKLLYRTSSHGSTSLYFWGSDETPLGGNTSESFTKVCDGNWNTAVTEITNPAWSGRINMFRLNTIKSTSRKGDAFDLKYIALFRTREEAESYEFVKGANFVTNKIVYNIGESIEISYLGTANGDWFGAFAQGEDPETAMPVVRKDAEATDAVRTLTFERNSDQFPIGDYTIYLFHNDGTVLQKRDFSVIQMADYRKLDKILSKVDDHSYYTDTTIHSFEDALARVERNQPASRQPEIDEQIAAVEEAFQKLKMKDADYWDVHSALDKIPGDLTVYTQESLDAITRAKQQVDWNKKINEQSVVNNYSAAITAAIDHLVRKDEAVSTSQNFSKVNGALAGADDLGRKLPMNDTVPNSREGKRHVGLFYFLWQGQHGKDGPFDNSRIVAEYPQAIESEENWLSMGGGPRGAHHFWGQPLFNYYTSDDEWVMHRHVQMLTDADVDFLVFDTTNAFTYTAQALKLMAILDEYRKQGWDVPQVAFYTNSSSGSTMNRIYDDIYKAHPEYKSLWFQWDGKPMIIGNAGDPDLSREVKDFFRIKANQWPNESKKDDGFPWMEFSRSLTDSAVYGTNGRREVMNVSIAQHSSTTRFSATAWYHANDHTRSWHDGENDTSDDAVNMGYNFAEQWEYAISRDPEMIFITGWNEWVAQRQTAVGREPIVFVDCADPNNSRDAEPMRGGHGDNYYMQMMNYIRKYKGTDARVDIGKNNTIDIDGSFDQWDHAAITARYQGFVGDTADRDAEGFGGVEYKNFTGRNDIHNMKVARDFDNIYFYVDTVKSISKPADEHWMTLFLNTGNEKHANWKGYDYVLNRIAPENGKAILERFDGQNWTRVAVVDMKVEGKQLMLAVPRDLLDAGKDQAGSLDLQFKWADNYQKEQDIWTFYEDGDIAPYGRLNYVFAGADETEEDMMFVRDGLSLKGSGMIRGNVGTNATGKNSVDFGWSTGIEGNLWVGPGGDWTEIVNSARPNPGENVSGEIRALSFAKEYTLPGFPKLPDLKDKGDLTAGWQSSDCCAIEESGAYGNINVTNDLTINIGKENIEIVADSLSVTGNGRILVNRNGNGRLILYVTDQLKLAGSGEVNPCGNYDDVFIYYGGEGPLNFDGNTKLSGSLFAEKADVALAGSGVVAGHIVTGGHRINLSGNAQEDARVIYAPEAVLTVAGSRSVQGTVIARSLELSGSAQIQYDPSMDPGFLKQLDWQQGAQ